MGARFFDLATLIVFGVIIADLVTHGTDTTNVLKGFNQTWQTSVNGMLGKSG